MRGRAPGVRHPALARRLLSETPQRLGRAIMFTFETIVPAGYQADRVTAAFYRFLDLQGLAAEEGASIHTEVLGEAERRTVLLWSEEAIRQFRAYLLAFDRVEA
jgi:hypothetical protein